LSSSVDLCGSECTGSNRKPELLLKTKIDMNKAILMLAAVFAFSVAAQAQNAAPPSPSPAMSATPSGTASKSTKSTKKHHKKHKSSKTEAQ
jgi:hypothetical protein